MFCVSLTVSVCERLRNVHEAIPGWKLATNDSRSFEGTPDRDRPRDPDRSVGSSRAVTRQRSTVTAQISAFHYTSQHRWEIVTFIE